MDGHTCPNHGEIDLETVVNGRHDGGGNEADNDEHATGDACVGLAEAVWEHDLVDQCRDAVKEADVDREGEEDDPELWHAGDSLDGVDQRRLWHVR